MYGSAECCMCMLYDGCCMFPDIRYTCYTACCMLYVACCSVMSCYMSYIGTRAERWSFDEYLSSNRIEIDGEAIFQEKVCIHVWNLLCHVYIQNI